MQPARFLITGGSQGIGAAIVELARKAGHQVVFTGRNEQLIETIARKTGAHGVRADVSVADDNARTVDDVPGTDGRRRRAGQQRRRTPIAPKSARSTSTR